MNIGMTITDYKLVSDRNMSRLEQEVVKHLEEGWSLWGSPLQTHVESNNSELIIMTTQPMVKYST